MALALSSKILIVDDFSMMRKVVINIFKQLGYHEMLEAEDGLRALEMVRKNPEIALVVTDWHMPNVNGLELLKALRNDPTTKNLPVIMITAEALQKNIVMAIKAGG